MHRTVQCVFDPHVRLLPFCFRERWLSLHDLDAHLNKNERIMILAFGQEDFPVH